MKTNKSLFTTLLPFLAAIGFLVLIFVWNKDPKSKNTITIPGPQTPPPNLLK
jgi:hypothetical protein